MPSAASKARPRQIVEYCRRCLPGAGIENRRVRLEQQGEIRLGPSKPWMPFTAVQTISARDIEFRWRAKFRLAGFVPGVVVDCYEDDRGQLDAWILGFIRVAQARGPKIDQSEAQRYLAEVAWCPMALTENRSLHFQELSSTTVRLVTCDDNTYVDLEFSADFDIVGVRTRTRYRDSERQPWAGRFGNHRVMNGVRVPTFGEVWWETPNGRFVYWRGNVTDFTLV